MTEFVVRLVDFCRRFALVVVLLFLAAGGGLSFYVVRSIAINTNIDQLMEENLDWRQNERSLAEAFPQNTDKLVIVVDGADPDKAEYAALVLVQALESRKDLFKSVERPDARAYFLKNGLLFLDEKELEEILETIVKAQPMLGSLAVDPSLRGLFDTVALAAQGVSRGDAAGSALAPAFVLMARTMESVLEGQKALLPWQSMLSSRTPSIRELRKFVLVQPVMDFAALSPGAKAAAAVRKIAQEEGLTPDKGVSVRLTGSVALNDEEFASVAQGAEMATGLSLVLVLLLLFLALRSARLIFPILLTLLMGLVATTAFALAAVGSLNLISVAFAAMFVGVAVDFGIQFGVRYREERYFSSSSDEALRSTARGLAFPLGLAAATTVLGLVAFVPTDYRGVAELGLISGVGMILAFILNMTFLPALLTLMRPLAEPESVGYAWAGRVDDFLIRKRRVVLILFTVLGLGGAVVAKGVPFDFDPLNLKDPESESVATLFDIMKDPDATPYTIQLLAPSLAEADKKAAEISKLETVDHVLTLTSFVPKDQEAKLALIEDAKFVLESSLHPVSIQPAPAKKEIEEALKKASSELKKIRESVPQAEALAHVIDDVLSSRDPALFARLDGAMVQGARDYLSRLRNMFGATTAGIDAMDEGLRRNWVAPDGRARLEVYPKGDAREARVLQAFTESVRVLAPEATGAPVAIQESGKTIMGAFVQAGVLAFVAIAVLLFVVLRRVRDVARALAPLFLSGILTLATMRLLGIPLNFANVIALPLLLSLGVSYAIYFVTYWRSGKERPLASPMARAVLFSAGTTLVAFFSLFLSAHMGTRSMGQLLTIALLYCLACTFLLLPPLLGRGRVG